WPGAAPAIRGTASPARRRPRPEGTVAAWASAFSSWCPHLVLAESGAGRDAAEGGGQRAAGSEAAADGFIRAGVGAVGGRIAAQRVPEIVGRQAGLDLAAVDDALVQLRGPADRAHVADDHLRDRGRVERQRRQQRAGLLVEHLLHRAEAAEGVVRLHHVAEVAERCMAGLAQTVAFDL